MGTGFEGEKLPQEGVLLRNYMGVVTAKFLDANLVALAVHLWSILGSCELLGTGGGMLKHAHYITLHYSTIHCISGVLTTQCRVSQLC